MEAATVNPLMLAKALRQRKAYERTPIQEAMNYPETWSEFGANVASNFPIDSPESVRKAAYDLAMNVGPQAIVWHGSPHKFSRFDSSNIGTGEGSQAFGHGLYVAEAPEVARQYAAIAQKPGLRQGSAKGSDMGVLDGLIKLNASKYTDGDVAKLAELVKNRPAAFADADGMLARIAEYQGNNPPAYIYKANLPDEQVARMLDWDRPFSQQAPEVRKALQDAEVVGRDDWLISGLRGREAYKRASFGAPVKLPLNQADDQIYAAERLQKAGIPGIRYLDSGSRKAGQGTSNFVVFPGGEDMLKILEINGVPVEEAIKALRKGRQ